MKLKNDLKMLPEITCQNRDPGYKTEITLWKTDRVCINFNKKINDEVV
jgi:hypothetical protein